VLRSNPVPRTIVTDQLRSYPAAKADIPALAHVKHVFVKAAARVNNRAEDSHQPTRRRERRMCDFRDARRTQAFLSCFGPIRQHFALPRHQMNTACHRAVLQERLATWHGWTVTFRISESSLIRMGFVKLTAIGYLFGSSASAHWMRHTSGSHQADGGVDLRTMRDNLGHVSLNTTSLYLALGRGQAPSRNGETHFN
jgi:hypothetical protein